MNEKSRKLIDTAAARNEMLSLDDPAQIGAAHVLLLAEIVDSLDSLTLAVRDLQAAIKSTS